jgi:hypothetical protein
MHHNDLVIHLARERDLAAVRRLAQLDSAIRPPAGTVLLASVDGRPVAARSLEHGTVVADPFVPTADAVRLLELRAAQLAAAGPAPARLRRLRTSRRRALRAT